MFKFKFQMGQVVEFVTRDPLTGEITERSGVTGEIIGLTQIKPAVAGFVNPVFPDHVSALRSVSMGEPYVVHDEAKDQTTGHQAALLPESDKRGAKKIPTPQFDPNALERAPIVFGDPVAMYKVAVPSERNGFTNYDERDCAERALEAAPETDPANA